MYLTRNWIVYVCLDCFTGRMVHIRQLLRKVVRSKEINTWLRKVIPQNECVYLAIMLNGLYHKFYELFIQEKNFNLSPPGQGW